MLDWIDNDTPGRWRRGLEPLLLAVVTFITTLALADICYPAFRGWYHGDGVYLGWIDLYWLLEPGLLTTWLIALFVALAMGFAVATGWSRRRFVRVAGGLLCLSSVLGAGLLVLRRPEEAVLLLPGNYITAQADVPWPALTGIMAGCFGGLWLAIGQGLTLRQSGLRRFFVAFATLAAAVVLGAATLADVLDEYQRQTFRPFQGKLMAVMLLQKGTSPAQGSETIEYEKKTYVVIKRHKPLWFTDKDVRRVRQVRYRDYRGQHTGVSIRFASRLHERIAKRTRRLARHALFEALYVDGRLLLVAQVQSVIHDGRILITDGPEGPRSTSKQIYQALTR